MADLPTIKMRPNKSPQRVRFGFPWVYSDELVLDRRSRKIPAGSLVQLTDTNGGHLGICAFNAESKITCRVLSQAETLDVDADWFVGKLKTALAMRDRVYPKPFYRLVHAEADGMPGVVVDRFGDAFVIQANAAWADRRIDSLVDALKQVCEAKTIIKNSAGRARSLEGLDDETQVLVGQADAPIPVPMNGATYMADLMGGQKTGLFFDQRDNQAFAAKLSNGARVLDVFSHVGGFSLAALANGASHATAVDASNAALDLASQGAEAMGMADRFETIKGDAFDVMNQMATKGKTYDLVVCDPPAFAPAKPALEAGLRAYERIARWGASLVEPGGYLVLCSCSHAADLAQFRRASLRGLGKSGRSGQIIHTGAAGPDHPTHPHLAESGYLKSIFLRLD